MKKVTFKPISSKLIVKRLEKEALSEGGIVIPDNLRDSYRKLEASFARVIACGPGRDELRHLDKGGMECSPGDLIMIPAHEGLSFKLDGEEFLSIYENLVLAIVGSQDDLES